MDVKLFADAIGTIERTEDHGGELRDPLSTPSLW